MRTTVTLDDEVFYRLEAIAQRTHHSFKDVLNDALMIGLHVKGSEEDSAPPFSVVPVKSGIKVAMDEVEVNAYLEELDGDDFLIEGSACDNP